MNARESKDLTFAMAWLHGYLAHDPEVAFLVEEDAETAGIGRDTLQRAKDALHVRAWRDVGGPWWWRLPEALERAREYPDEDGDSAHTTTRTDMHTRADVDACYACHGVRYWRNTAGARVCARCHPQPSTQGMV